MPIAIKIILIVICSYFLGNITFARPVAKTLNDDITTHGSGNPGTMNMMRTHGAKYGFITLGLDMLKGIISCLCAYYIFGGKDGGKIAELMKYVAGFCCFIGHLYPIVYKFKGGKGVATACGIAFCVNPLLMTGVAFVFVGVMLWLEIASFASMLSTVLFVLIDTIFICLSHNYYCLIPLYLIMFFIIYAHRANIKRLIHGNENKVPVRKYFIKKKKTEETPAEESTNKEN